MNDICNLYILKRKEILELIKYLLENETKSLSQFPIITTLKATLFLLYYNLLESIVYMTFELLFDEIHSNCAEFSELSPKVQSQYNKYSKRSPMAPDDLLQLSLMRYSGCITLFSGNLDARAIRDLLKDWGIASNFHVGGEEKLLDIKNFRNKLAHGEKAFKEIGRNYTMKEMQQYEIALTNYLEALLTTFKKYFLDKSYKADNASTF